MPDFPYVKNEFLSKVIAAIEENLSDEHFGVTELANKISMSRSNLLRKVKGATDLSVSLLIRQVRLYHAKDLLNEGERNISEISYMVGFSSTSYFTKCFREQFGYPPGEESKKSTEQKEQIDKKKKSPFFALAGSIVLIVSIILFLIYSPKEETPNEPLEKTTQYCHSKIIAMMLRISI